MYIYIISFSSQCILNGFAKQTFWIIVLSKNICPGRETNRRKPDIINTKPPCFMVSFCEQCRKEYIYIYIYIKANNSFEKNTTAAAAAGATSARRAKPASPPGRRCRRCCCYCGILFMAVVCLTLYIIF